MKKPKRCGNCGSVELISSKEAEFHLPWKGYPAVLLTQPVDAWVCSDCGELIISASKAKVVDDIIKTSITSHINDFINMIVLRENCEQKDIAGHIGVSPEYLSEIKSGRKTPKFQTFNFLKTLAVEKNSYKVASPTFKDWKSA